MTRSDCRDEKEIPLKSDKELRSKFLDIGTRLSYKARYCLFTLKPEN